MRKDVWIFPDLPAELVGLTQETIARMKDLVLQHGMLIPEANGAGLMIREPAPMCLLVSTAPGTPGLQVRSRDLSAGRMLTIVFAQDDSVVWDDRISVEQVELVLSADTVIKTSEIDKANKAGPS